MSNPPTDPKRFSRLRRIEQITENHCGPAVIQMLLENIEVNVTQEEITETKDRDEIKTKRGEILAALERRYVGEDLRPCSTGGTAS